MCGVLLWQDYLRNTSCHLSCASSSTQTVIPSLQTDTPAHLNMCLRSVSVFICSKSPWFWMNGVLHQQGSEYQLQPVGSALYSSHHKLIFPIQHQRLHWTKLSVPVPATSLPWLAGFGRAAAVPSAPGPSLLWAGCASSGQHGPLWCLLLGEEVGVVPWGGGKEGAGGGGAEAVVRSGRGGGERGHSRVHRVQRLRLPP